MKHVTLIILLFFFLAVEGKVVHLRPGVELPVMIPSNWQNILDKPYVSSRNNYSWSVSNTNIKIRSTTKYTCTLYYSSGLHDDSEVKLKYHVSYLVDYVTDDYDCEWTIKVSPRGDKRIWGDMQEDDFFQDYTEEDHLMLFQLNRREGILCADVIPYDNGNPCISTSVKGKITIPEYSQGFSVQYIWGGSFSNLSDLTDLVLPSTLKYLESTFIGNCRNLKTLTCLAETPPSFSWGDFEFYLTRNTILYVPQGCKDKYKKAKGWKEFSIIREIGQPVEGAAIDDSNFPDIAFRNIIMNYDKDKDKILSDDEIYLINYLNLENLGISSLKGIEYLYFLEKLYCSRNDIKELDLSKNTALTSLDCSINQLSTLDVSKNTALTYLSCFSNQLLTLDISKNTALTYLSCYSNQLSALDVSKNTQLSSLNCSSNQLASLDVSKNTQLSSLLCSSNQLASLDVSNNMALKSLECGNNALASLNISMNKDLTNLDCYNNMLISLDVSSNKSLEYLDCSRNIIKGKAMDNLVNGLTKNTTDKSHELHVVAGTNDGNFCTTAHVAVSKSKGWIVYRYSGMFSQKYEGRDPNAFGDVTDDEKVDSKDLDEVTKYILAPPKTFIQKLDINGDRKVNAADLTAIVNLILYKTITPPK